MAALLFIYLFVSHDTWGRERIRGQLGVDSAKHGISRAVLPVNGMRNRALLCVRVASAPSSCVHETIPAGVLQKDFWTLINLGL